MPRLVLPRYTVIRDTREQEGHGWTFDAHPPERRPPNCMGTIISTLKTGDYSAVGYEDILAIERKRNFAELWGNYSKDKKAAFENEMERMSHLKYRFLIVEDVLTTDIMELSPPQYRSAAPGKSMIRWLMKLMAKHQITFMPVAGCGKKVAQMIIEEVIRMEKDRWDEKDIVRKKPQKGNPIDI